MAHPFPAGAVITYPYLWRWQSEEGRLDAPKDRPTCLAITIPDPRQGLTHLVLLAISGTAPSEGQTALEIPVLELRRAGLSTLKRGWITSGELQRWVDRGVRGITSNPSIFAKAIEGARDYDDQFGALIHEGQSVEDSYWRMVVDDIQEALRILRPVYDESGGTDGFVSVEVSPALARDTAATIDEARKLWSRIDQPIPKVSPIGVKRSRSASTEVSPATWLKTTRMKKRSVSMSSNCWASRMLQPAS